MLSSASAVARLSLEGLPDLHEPGVFQRLEVPREVLFVQAASQCQGVVGGSYCFRMRRETFLDPPGNRWSVNVATTRGERVRGLRGRPGLREYEALLLPRARSVHTFGIRVPITVVLLDRDYRVIGIRHLPPRRLLLPRPGVRHVMECGPMADLRVGDVLRLEAAAGRKGRRID